MLLYHRNGVCVPRQVCNFRAPLGRFRRIFLASEPRIEFVTRRRETPGPLGCRESMRSPLIAAYRLEVCRLEVCRHVGHRGRGRWVGRPEAGRDARRRGLGGGLDHACRRRHCSR